jgi:Asp-tRNA(Asn)/Glu-tRNA(Gln) amidotransferase A subunit family amidase
MALAWTMDKIGAIARSAADCALVFAAIQGADPGDPYSRSAPFSWPQAREPRSLRVGYVKALFDEDYGKMADKDEDKRAYEEWKAFDARSLDVLRKIGFELTPIDLTFSVPVGSLSAILTAEAACAMREMAKIVDKIDVYVVPSFGGDNELLTNLTGHPAVVVPNGFRAHDGTPTSITFQGKLDGDDLALAVADAYQRATDFHTRRPPV